MSHRRPRRPARALLAAAAALLAAACGDDGAGPADPLTLRTTALVEGTPTVYLLEDGTPYLQCVVRLNGSVSGPGDATVRGAMLRWFYGTERTQFDSLRIAASEFEDGYVSGSPTLRAGEPVVTRWQMSATIPFDGEIVLRYQPDGGEVREATAGFRCGPPVPPGAAPPQVASLTVTPPPGLLEVGDTLEVEFTATSPAALWRSRVALSGPCELDAQFVEPLGTSTTRRARLVIPSHCELGQPISVSASVLDGAARLATRSVNTGLSVVDVTPPQLSLWLGSSGGGASTSTLSGTTFSGDSLHFMSAMLDAGGVRWLTWELLPSGTRDSIAASSVGVVGIARIPVRDTWLAMERVRFRLRDRAGNESAPLEMARGTLVVGRASARATRSLSIPGEVRHAVVDARRDLVWIQQTNQSRIVALDRASMGIVRTIQLPAPPVGMDLTAGGDSIVLTFPGLRRLAILDLRPATPALVQHDLPILDTVQLDQRPGTVYAMANGHAFLTVAGNGPGSFALVDIDLATLAMRRRTDVDFLPAVMARSHDRRVLVMNGGENRFRRWTSATDAFSAPATAPLADGAPTLDEAGARLALGRHVYDGTTFVRSVASPYEGFGGWATTLSSDGQHVYHLVNGVLRSRVSDGALVDKVALSDFQAWTDGRLLTWPGSDRLVAIRTSPSGPSEVTIVE